MRHFEITPCQSGEIKVILTGASDDKDLEKCMTRLVNYIQSGVVIEVKKNKARLTLSFERRDKKSN
jgi:hypothetical protein